MPKTHKISKEEAEEIKQVRSGIKDKDVDKRLHAVQLRGEGLKNKEIAQKLDTSPKVVSNWVSLYVKYGLEGLLPKKRESHHWNISFKDEQEMLDEFKEKAKTGQIIEVSEIKNEYVKRVGHEISTGQIYRVFKRHNWRKVMPRSRHPKEASDEAIEASKKLNPKRKIKSAN